MEKRLKSYLQYMEEMSANSLSDEARAELRAALLIQIRFFQHERLIHLIVTVTFALLALMSLFAGMFAPSIPLFILIALLLILLIPYIRHYFILENGVQRLYSYYDGLGE
ncbi:MAG: hypothetical protein Q4B48_07215 [Syntrophomonadaceae bacterium]|nr:hypothetical protein [Syntrophomonadaceae bacterium]